MMHECGLCSLLPWRHGHSSSQIFPCLLWLPWLWVENVQPKKAGPAEPQAWVTVEPDTQGCKHCTPETHKLYRVPVTPPPQKCFKNKRKECTPPCEVRRCGWNNPHTMLFIKGTIWIPHRDWLNPQYGVLCSYEALTKKLGLNENTQEEKNVSVIKESNAQSAKATKKSSVQKNFDFYNLYIIN